MNNIWKITKKIFVSGAPGSRWSGICERIQAGPGYNTSDRSEARLYEKGDSVAHFGSYFGTGMEFPPDLNDENLHAPFESVNKITYLLLKSHEWVYKLDEITEKYPSAGILLIYRPNETCFDWWTEAGGWNITYPNYDWYENDNVMKQKISEQNDLMLRWSQKKHLVWKPDNKHYDVLLAKYQC